MSDQPRALSYLRVSSKGQIDGDGFDRQRDSIRSWMSANGVAHLGEFCEEGVSGTTDLLNRPALTRLTERILEGGIDMVIIEKADRLARDLVVSELLLRQFSELGVRVIEAEGGTDLTEGDDDNPTAKLIRQVLGAVAEFEKSSVVSKLRKARNRKRAATGRCEGNKPYGMMPGEEAVVRVILNLRSEELTTREIAEELNNRGYRTRQGKQWRHPVIARIISRTNGIEV